MKFFGTRKIDYRFAFGISCYRKKCSFVHHHIPLGYHKNVERQRRKAS